MNVADHDEATCTDEDCWLWEADHSVYVHWSPSLGKWVIEDTCPDCHDQDGEQP